MAHVFRAKSFIKNATALADGEKEIRGEPGISGEAENYLEVQDAGSVSTDIDEVLSITSCKLSGDRVFVLVVIEDEVAGG